MFIDFQGLMLIYRGVYIYITYELCLHILCQCVFKNTVNVFLIYVLFFLVSIFASCVVIYCTQCTLWSPSLPMERT